MTYAIRIGADERASITCHVCGWTSYHPEDVRQRYCGACHLFHEDFGGGIDTQRWRDGEPMKE